MRIGVFRPTPVPRSMSITTGNILRVLEENGAELLYFADPEQVPAAAQMLWDPWVGGGHISVLDARKIDVPVVLTIAGASIFSMRPEDIKLEGVNPLRHWFARFRLGRRWQRMARHYERVVTISDYARQEILDHLPLRPEQVERVYLGKDATLFDELEDDIGAMPSEPFLLHLSYYRTKKNVDRMVEAYARVADRTGMPDFYVVATGYPRSSPHDKIKIVADDVSRAQIAAYYRRAMAFVFPSLHETFGMPLTEAMVFSLPILTSTATCCPETAGDAAVLVDPYDVDSIAQGLVRMVEDEKLRADLAQKSKRRGEDFSWEQTGREYHRIFSGIV